MVLNANWPVSYDKYRNTACITKIYNELWILWRFPPLRTDASFIVYEGSRLKDSPPLPRLPLRASLLLNLSKDNKGVTIK